jgi:hypothetical protein
MIKTLIAGVASLAVLGSAGVAHATPQASAQYFQCLENHGVSVTDTDIVLDIARRIQNDERNGVPRWVIINNLETRWNIPVYIANVEVDCAWATINL